MAESTESAHVNRLITLLMMLPSPCSRDTFAPFWDRVAEDLNTNTNYVTGKIALHLKLLQGAENPTLGRSQLASYALSFFGQPSEKLVRSIATEVDAGTPDDIAGQVWVQELRTTAFAVMEETFPEDHLHRALDSWVRFDH
ncbi:hypothetical protein ABZ234_08200 [Nocardiopsis sp. NPDC006198]|uniref:hypothetical protein n=1 Tax=Nocardiopsis sp. NPDC006198 TaxID=3154472 RepID=UPI0033B09DB3